jgi:hypothetical protein
MVAKTKTKGSQKKGKVKVGKLILNKETVKDLTTRERKRIKGGIIGLGGTGICPTASCLPNTRLEDGCSPIQATRAR